MVSTEFETMPDIAVDQSVALTLLDISDNM